MALRVLHIGKFYPPHRGGMEVFLADLVQQQRSQGLDAHALVHGQPQPDDPPWLTRVPVQFHLSYAPMALGFRRALDRAIKRIEPDVLHLHMPNNSALWVLTLPSARPIPWVVHWHADVVVARIGWLVAAAYRLYRPFEQAVLSRTQRILVTSPAYLEASEPLQAWHRQCAIVPLGVPLSLAGAEGATGDLLTASAAWSPGVLRLLSIGRLTYYKGFETLIEAVSTLAGVELLIVGEGELRPELERRIARHTPANGASTVRLLGNLSDADKNTLLGACDIFCMASLERTEAFGIVLLEAMLQAKPCLVSDLPGSGMPWVVRETGAGHCVPLGDVVAWRQAITRLQTQPQERQVLGQAGWQGVRSAFSMEVCERRIYREYALAAPEVRERRHPHMAQSTMMQPGEQEQPRVLVVIPARDEAATIGEVLHQLQTAGWHDALVIDDHSCDSTGAIAAAAGAVVLKPSLPMGAWGGMQAGIRYALRHGYQAVITMDADGQHEVAEIPALLRAQAQADLVVGAYPERASALRQWAWSWFRRLAGFDLRDLTSGFRLYNLEAMRVLGSRQATMLDYQDLGALLMIRRAGLRIVEVPVAMNLRSAGKSRIFHSWWSVAKYMGATTLLCLARR